jgi:oligosaccharide repeat unit polymerase
MMFQNAIKNRQKSKITDFFSPTILSLGLCLPSMIIFLIIPENDFYSFFSSRKSNDLIAVSSFCFAVLVFVIGAFFGEKVLKKNQLADFSDYFSGKILRKLLFYITTISLFAYSIWFSLALFRANGLNNFLQVYSVNPFWVKSYFFATIPGITTLTQLSVASVPLMIALKNLGSKEKIVILLVIVFALIRSIFSSERLALIEILLPGIFVVLAQNLVKKRYFLPVLFLGLGFLVTFFIFSESRRSFVYTGAFSYLDAFYRLFSYYMTSINNGIYVLEHFQGVAPFHFSLQSLWKFPLIGDALYQQFNTVSPSGFPENWLLVSGNNPEYTTLTAIGEVFIEYGVLGFPVLFLFGSFLGIVFKASLSSSFAVALYGVLLVGVFEFLREGYLWGVRVFPAFMVFSLVFLVYSVQTIRKLPNKRILTAKSMDEWRA